MKMIELIVLLTEFKIVSFYYSEDYEKQLESNWLLHDNS